MEIFPHEVFVRGVNKSHKTVKAITIVLDYIPEIEVKMLFLKTTHTLDTGLGGKEWGTNIEASFLRNVSRNNAKGDLLVACG